MEHASNLLYTLFTAALAGLVQTSTGFGAGVIVMLFWPMFLSMLEAGALSSLTTMWIGLLLTWRYRKSIKFNLIIIPSISFFVAFFLSLRIVTGHNIGNLKAYFGLFLVLIAIYFMFMSDKLKIKATPLAGVICGGLSGITSALFGFGGPPMVIFALAAIDDDKEAYIGTLNCFFALSSVYSNIVRIFDGIVTVDLLPLVAVGSAGMFIGKFFGAKIVDRINMPLMKKLIYIFLGISGILTFITNI